MKLKVSKKDQQIKDVKEENTELKGFLNSSKQQIADYCAIIHDILEIHSPYVDMTHAEYPNEQHTPKPMLRCTICDTPEHHTWGPANDEPWPCATVRTFLATMPPEVHDE